MFGRPGRTATGAAIYAAIVAQSRRPVFYSDYGVPDSLDGRFDLIVLHLALVIRRLMRDDPLRGLAQEVFDAFCRDMDDNLREMGVGDLAVPKKMLQFGEAFYGRLKAYEKALDGGGRAALAAALARNVLAGADPASPQALRLATYTAASETALAGEDMAAIVAGTVSFADPAGLETGQSSETSHDPC